MCLLTSPYKHNKQIVVQYWHRTQVWCMAVEGLTSYSHHNILWRVLAITGLNARALNLRRDILGLCRANWCGGGQNGRLLGSIWRGCGWGLNNLRSGPRPMCSRTRRRLNLWQELWSGGWCGCHIDTATLWLGGLPKVLHIRWSCHVDSCWSPTLVEITQNMCHIAGNIPFQGLGHCKGFIRACVKSNSWNESHLHIQL